MPSTPDNASGVAGAGPSFRPPKPDGTRRSPGGAAAADQPKNFKLRKYRFVDSILLAAAAARPTHRENGAEESGRSQHRGAAAEAPRSQLVGSSSLWTNCAPLSSGSRSTTSGCCAASSRSLSLGSWAKASGKLTALFAKNQSRYQGRIRQRQKPSQGSVPSERRCQRKAAGADHAASEADVAKLWQQLYDRQREHVLEWPSPPLTKEFRRLSSKSCNSAPRFAPTCETIIRITSRITFPSCPKQIEARAIDPSVTAGPGGGGEFRSGRGFAEAPGGTGTELLDETNYICEWSPTDQALVRDELNFSPTAYSLENLGDAGEFVGLSHAPRCDRQNQSAANATRISNAAVQQIGELSVGPRAASRQPCKRSPLGETGCGCSRRGAGGSWSRRASGRRSRSGTCRPAAEFIARWRWSRQRTDDRRSRKKAICYQAAISMRDGKPIPFGGGGAAAASPDAPAPAPDPAAASQPLDLSSFGSGIQTASGANGFKDGSALVAALDRRVREPAAASRSDRKFASIRLKGSAGRELWRRRYRTGRRWYRRQRQRVYGRSRSSTVSNSAGYGQRDHPRHDLHFQQAKPGDSAAARRAAGRRSDPDDRDSAQ